NPGQSRHTCLYQSVLTGRSCDYYDAHFGRPKYLSVKIKPAAAADDDNQRMRWFAQHGCPVMDIQILGFGVNEFRNPKMFRAGVTDRAGTNHNRIYTRPKQAHDKAVRI